jgi:hypothetical protein
VEQLSERPERETDSFAFLALKFLALALPGVFNIALFFYALTGVVFQGERYLDWDAEFRQLVWLAVGVITGFSLLVLALLAWLRPPYGPGLLWGSVVNAAVPLLIAGAYFALR